MKRALAILGWFLGLFLGGTAYADLTVPARGSATVTGGDVAAAKARALDDALRQAVDQAVATLDPKIHEAAADLVKKRILRRARAYVLRYKVTAEGEGDGVYSVTVDATIADGPLGSDVQALAAASAPPPPRATPTTTTTPPPAARPTLALLAVTRQGEEVFATFGRGAGDAGPIAPALEHALAARGFRVVRAAGLEVPLAAEGGQGVPLDVSQSTALARQAGAGGALVAGILIRDGGRIRGTRRVGAEIEVWARLDDATAATRLAEDHVQAAGHGAAPAEAVAGAAHAALMRLDRSLGKRLESHWPDTGGATAPTGGVLVHLRGVASGADVDALLRALAHGEGSVVPQRYARREVTLLVKGATDARSLAAVAAATTLGGARVRARATGAREVDVELSADSAAPEPLPAKP